MGIQSLLDALQNLLHTHVGLGYFVDLVLKSTFVLVLMILGTVFTRRFPASLRHLLWCIGIACLFVLPLFIGLLPKIHVPIEASDTVIIESTVTRGIVSFADNADLVFTAWWEAFLALYFAFLGMQLLYIGLGLCKVFSLSRSARRIANPTILSMLDSLVTVEGITVPVALKQSTQVYSPVSWGLFAPEIILPVDADSWCPEKTRNVLIHELSHIQRLDWLTTLVVRLTCALYWFNPLVWFAARRLDEEAERACDDAVILTGRSHSQYASNLLEIAQHARHHHVRNAVVQAIAASFLGSRVFSILDTSKRRQNTELDWVVRGLLFGGIVIAILASLRFVPLVNVTSIDPHSSTAFSVMFVSRNQAMNYGEDVESLIRQFEEQERERNRQKESAAGDQAEVTDIVGRKPGTNATKETQSRSQQVAEGTQIASAATKTETADSQLSGPGKTSLLEEYLSVNGLRLEDRQLESFVSAYTSNITRDVESGIDFGRYVDDGEDADVPTVVAIRRAQPDYPNKARRRGLEGYTVVEYAIDSNGYVIDPIIVDSSPGTVFNQSSIRAIQNYRFEPPQLEGKVVSLKGQQTKFVYQLKPG